MTPSRYASSYVRFVLWRRRVEAARAALWVAERRARPTRLFAFVWLLDALGGVVAGRTGVVWWFTIIVIGILVVRQGRVDRKAIRAADEELKRRQADVPQLRQ